MPAAAGTGTGVRIILAADKYVGLVRRNLFDSIGLFNLYICFNLFIGKGTGVLNSR